MQGISHYRPDIDGLRALAVGGVVLFHAMPAALNASAGVLR
jgi:peptidoglycan/LPS O-acetylase OafA/YrhL